MMLFAHTHLIVLVVTVISSSSRRIDKPLTAEKEDDSEGVEVEVDLVAIGKDDNGRKGKGGSADDKSVGALRL